MSTAPGRHSNSVFLRYGAGSVIARFYHSTFDYIELDLRMGGETTWIQEWDQVAQRNVGAEKRVSTASIEQTVYFSSVWCAFPSLIRFLEAIAIGVEECAFSWDPEGPFGEMRWRGGGRNGTFTITWSGGERFRWSTWLPAHDLVAGLYGAFRAFVESDEYDPVRYERLRTWELYALVLSDAGLGDLARALASRSSAEAGRVLQRLEVARERRRSTPNRREPLEWFLRADDDEPEFVDLPRAWDGWTRKQRLRHLGRKWRWPAQNCWDGSNLRALKSPIVEDWLARRRRSR